MNNYLPQYGAYQYNPMANMQRFQTQEQIQQTMPQQITGINGRIVQEVDNINANEVPMDGSMAFFPKQDLSEIYVKGWNADGTIRTTVFKPVSNSNGINTSNIVTESKISLSEEVTEGIMKRFDEIETKLCSLESSLTKSTTKTSSKSKISQDLVQD
jgi:hypothetical protein